MKYLLWAMILIPKISMANFSYIPDARTLAASGSEFEFGLTYFQTNGFIDESGKGFAIESGTSYQQYDFDFVGKYGFTNRLEGQIGLKGRLIQATDDFSGQGASYNQSGVESSMIGFKFSFPEDEKTKYALQGWYRGSLYSNAPYTFDGTAPADIALGEGSREIALGFNAYYRTPSSNFIGTKIFYRSPAQTASPEIFSEFEYAAVWEHFVFAFGVENVYSLGEDSYSNDTNNKPRIYTGQSRLYNSTNRSWTAPYIQMNFSFGGQWRVETQLAQVTTGSSTDVGPKFGINLIRRSDKSKEFQTRDTQFKQYRIEGLVTKVSKSRNTCLIDKGIVTGVTKGMGIDFYHFDYIDGNQLIARGVVIKVKSGKALVKITKRYSKKRVESGTVARAGQLN
jgi:hypothetical protein